MAKHLCRTCGGPAALVFDDPSAHEDFPTCSFQRAAWCEGCCLMHVFRVNLSVAPPIWDCVYCGASPPPGWHDLPPQSVH